MFKFILSMIILVVWGNACNQSRTSRKREDSDKGVSSFVASSIRVSSETTSSSTTQTDTKTHSSTESTTTIVTSIISTTKTTTNTSSSTQITTTTGTKNSSDLVGVWATDCYKTADWFIDKISFTSANSTTGSFTLKHSGYVDDTCQSLLSTVIVVGAYTLGQGLSSPSGAQQIDIPATSINYIPAIASLVTTLNTQNICGINTWLLNQPTDIRGKACFYTDAPYTIFSISGTSLQMGANPGTSISNRATTLNSLIFKKN